MAKTHVQHVAIAAAINIDRLVAWLDERPRAQTRTSRFAALVPAAALNPGEAAAERSAESRASSLHEQRMVYYPALTYFLLQK